MRFILVLGLAGALSGCMTAEERMARDNDQCLSYGVQRGSPAYVDCRMKLDQNRANIAASERFGQGAPLIRLNRGE